MHLRKISVIGLGYVGLPVAVAFGQQQEVVAFDIKEQRISELQQSFDTTDEVTKQELTTAQLFLTSEPSDLNKADFHIVAVPTPISSAKQPNLNPLIVASKIVGLQLKQGDIVVYESTVYPGATEEVCVPVLEEHSNLKCGKDFFIGYSPERINPGDKEHQFTTIKKIVAGQNDEILNIVAEVYASVVTAGIHKASSIKVAEAAKVIENTQRDLNIAFVNELALICDRLNIDTVEVLEAAGSKWNFLPFRPGLVGGHCIGVDPFYLTHKAEMIGYHPQVILAGRRLNDGMGKYIAEQTVKKIIHAHKQVKGARVGVLGLTFKENCPDIRNTKVIDIIRELEDYGIKVLVCDPFVEPEEAKREFGIELIDCCTLKDLDAIILAVAHKEFLTMPVAKIIAKLAEPKILMDVKSVLDRNELQKMNVDLWRL
jgi:UDP-N-acetyl-D-glucosamine/UDP-N-acetyl-D-galactosamine dehydrogenase